MDISEPGDEFLAVSKRFEGKLFSAVANVTDEQTVTAAIDHIIEEAGSFHGMVVNAGKTHHKPALDFTPDEIHSLFAINVRGTIPLVEKPC